MGGRSRLGESLCWRNKLAVRKFSRVKIPRKNNSPSGSTPPFASLLGQPTNPITAVGTRGKRSPFHSLISMQTRRKPKPTKWMIWKRFCFSGTIFGSCHRRLLHQQSWKTHQEIEVLMPQHSAKWQQSTNGCGKLLDQPLKKSLGRAVRDSHWMAEVHKRWKRERPIAQPSVLASSVCAGCWSSCCGGHQ